MTDDRQQLSDLISAVYDAAIDPSLWEGVIERVACFVGGVGGGLFCKDVDAQYVMTPHRFGITWPLPVELFRTIYPAAVGHFLAEIEQPIATADLMPYEELTASALYKEWAGPQGLIDFVSAVLDKSATSVVMFGVFRHQRNGFVDRKTRDRMRLIAPHIRRAVLIARMFDLGLAEAGILSETVDGLDAGLYLVDACGRIIHANASGQALLDAGGILYDSGGRLTAREAQASQKLREVLAAAAQGDAAIGTRGIAVPLLGKDGERYVAHALPLTSGARRRTGTACAAVAALFVRKAELALAPGSDVIGKAFKLTPTELRVLLAIVEVGGIPDVAAALGVADTTVRTHVNRVFDKTGVTRQADLVKLVAGYATPLAPRHTHTSS